MIPLSRIPLPPAPSIPASTSTLSATARPIAVCPLLTNARMRAQKACFTLAPDTLTPIDASDDPSVLSVIPIPRDAVADAWRFLHRSAVAGHSVFPDFAGIAAHFDQVDGRVREAIRAVPQWCASVQSGVF